MLDYFHVNSIEPLPNGELLISSRNTWATYLISEATGAVLWRLGGKQSTFNARPGRRSSRGSTTRSCCPTARSASSTTRRPRPRRRSRASLDIALDPTAHTATLVHQLTYPGKGILSESQGDVQPLANGDAFVGWGQAGEVSEFSPAGALTFDMHFAAAGEQLPRVPLSPGTPSPTTPPALAGGAAIGRTASSGRAGTAPPASPPGACSRARRRRALASVGTYPSQGFETSMAPTTAPYVEVQALGASGALLSTSHVAKG